MLKKDAQELMAAIRSQYDRIRQDQEFLKLKESELRPGDEMSFFGFWEAKQNLAMEQSLLAGHVFMIRQGIRQHRISIDVQMAKILEQIANTFRLRYV